MKEIYVVTGNAGKMRELQAIFPSSMNLKSQALDLSEIQSLDTEEVVRDKLERAFEIIGRPVIVDDVSAELDHLNGLPGPFIKYFEQSLGKGALWKLVAHTDNHALLVRCTLGYYDGKTHYITQGEIRGKVVPPRGDHGFGFDFVFVPEGETLTFAEMPQDHKNKISHRAQAAAKLVQILG